MLYYKLKWKSRKCIFGGQKYENGNNKMFESTNEKLQIKLIKTSGKYLKLINEKISDIFFINVQADIHEFYVMWEHVN